MVNFLSTWAEGIIIAVLIATIIEMILPNGNSKKYVKVVIGIYVLFNIIFPICNVFKKDKLNIDKILDTNFYEKKIEKEILDTANLIKNNNSRTIEDIYASNLKNDIKNKLEEKGYLIKDLKLEINKEKEYKIKKIIVYLNSRKDFKDNNKNNKEDKQNNREINEIKINKINIDNNNIELDIEKTNENKNISKFIIEDIRDYINKVYYVKKQNIEVL